MKSVYVQTVNNRRRFELNVDDGITATALRQLVASSADLPPDRLKLVLKGKPIIDSDASVSIDHGDTLLALTGPPVPPKYPLPGAEDDISDDEDAVKFQVSQLSSPLARRLAAFLLHTLRFPDEVVDFLFKIRLRTLLAFVIWALVSRVVAAYGWGPVYIMVSVMAFIFINLGSRRPGEASAYSVFNEGFRELPGTLNAERMDDQLRRGQL